MTDSSAGTGGQPPASSLLGPAVPPRVRAPIADAALDGSIGPFVPGRARGQAAPETGQQPAAPAAPAALPPTPPAAEEPAEELPWLALPEEVTPAALEEPVATETPFGHGWDEHEVHEPAAADRADGTIPSPFDDSGGHQPSGDVLDAIAARLERIARALRSRTGDDFGGDAGDPLEVLITGYALGYSDGLRQGGGEEV